MNMLEVVYLRSDGVTVRSLAFYSYRRGPVGEWMVGDVPLSALDGTIIYQGPRMGDAEFALLVEGQKPVIAEHMGWTPDDAMFKCTEHFLPTAIDPRAARATTQEESDVMIIAFAIEPGARFDLHPPTWEDAAKQEALRQVAQRVREALVRYRRLETKP